ncbi:MAG: hypothetical protein RIB84_24260 [Sneathiellaceae bacterium]
MGVPTITLRGRFPSGRASAAILAACGLARWIAEDEAGFAALAARLGAGVQGLRAGRGQMRQTLRGTIPFNGPAYAAAVERTYRALWRERCAAPA